MNLYLPHYANITGSSSVGRALAFVRSTSVETEVSPANWFIKGHGNCCLVWEKTRVLMKIWPQELTDYQFLFLTVPKKPTSNTHPPTPSPANESIILKMKLSLYLALNFNVNTDESGVKCLTICTVFIFELISNFNVQARCSGLFLQHARFESFTDNRFGQC